MSEITFNRMVKNQQGLDNVFGALSDRTRRAIISSLAKGPKTVGELARPFDISLAAVSKHLSQLDRAGLVERQRHGRNIECRLRPQSLKVAADWITDYESFWTERLRALDELVKERQRNPE